MKPAVLVAGATGQVGLFAVAGLLDAGRDVIAITREGAGLEQTKISGLRRMGWHSAFDWLATGAAGPEGRLSLLSCGPVRLARDLLLAADDDKFHGWDRAVITGTTSTVTKIDSPDPLERGMVAGIQAVCDEMREICRSADIPLAVLSPTLIYGCGMDQNLSRVYHWIQQFGFAPVASRSHGLRQPLHVADLAQTLANAMLRNLPRVLESPVCGADAIAYHEMIARLFDAAGRKRRLIRLPRFLIPVAVGFSRLISGVGDLNREMFHRQAQDLVFDDVLAREQFGHDPRLYQPQPEDFRLPNHIAHIRKQLL